MHIPASLTMSAGAGVVVLYLLFVAAMVASVLLRRAQSVVGAGLPGGRAGIDALLQRVKCSSNIGGAGAGAAITVSGIKPGDTVLSVIAGDGTDLGASTVAVTADDTITCSVNTTSKKLTVLWIAESSTNASQGTEYDPTWGVLDDLIFTRLRVSVIAGANGALTLTGLTTADTLLGLWLTDGTTNLSTSTWAVTADTLTPTASVDTSSKHVVVLWIDDSASAVGNGQDINTSYGLHKAEGFAALMRGLRISSAAGPNGAGNITAGSFANIDTDDNILGIAYSTSATDPLDDAWTVKSGGGGVSYAGSENLSAGIVYCLWFDVSAAGVAA